MGPLRMKIGVWREIAVLVGGGGWANGFPEGTVLSVIRVKLA
jgi:hypothetical protein